MCILDEDICTVVEQRAELIYDLATTIYKQMTEFEQSDTQQLEGIRFTCQADFVANVDRRLDCQTWASVNIPFYVFPSPILWRKLITLIHSECPYDEREFDLNELKQNIIQQLIFWIGNKVDVICGQYPSIVPNTLKLKVICVS